MKQEKNWGPKIFFVVVVSFLFIWFFLFQKSCNFIYILYFICCFAGGDTYKITNFDDFSYSLLLEKFKFIIWFFVVLFKKALKHSKSMATFDTLFQISKFKIASPLNITKWNLLWIFRKYSSKLVTLIREVEETFFLNFSLEFLSKIFFCLHFVFRIDEATEGIFLVTFFSHSFFISLLKIRFFFFHVTKKELFNVFFLLMIPSCSCCVLTNFFSKPRKNKKKVCKEMSWEEK